MSFSHSQTVLRTRPGPSTDGGSDRWVKTEVLAHIPTAESFRTGVGHTSLSGPNVWCYKRSSCQSRWHHKGDPQPFPDSARGALRTTRHGGSGIIGDCRRGGRDDLKNSAHLRPQQGRGSRRGVEEGTRRAGFESSRSRVRRGRVWGRDVWACGVPMAYLCD